MTMDLMGAIPLFASLAGTLFQQEGYSQASDAALTAGGRSRAAGERSKVALDFEAAQLDQSAGQSIAASQREAANQRRLAAIVGSRALAVAAASGGGASDPTVVNLIADIHGEGAYRSMVKMYQGEDRARLLRMGAAGKRYEGEVAKLRGIEMEEAFADQAAGYETAADGALLKDGLSMLSKYGMGGPKSGSGTPSPTGGSDGWGGYGGGYYDTGWVDAGTPDFSSFG